MQKRQLLERATNFIRNTVTLTQACYDTLRDEQYIKASKSYRDACKKIKARAKVALNKEHKRMREFTLQTVQKHYKARRTARKAVKRVLRPCKSH